MKNKNVVSGILTMALCASVLPLNVFAETQNIEESLSEVSVTTASYGGMAEITSTENGIKYYIKTDGKGNVDISAFAADALKNTVYFKSETKKTEYNLGQIGVSYDIVDAAGKVTHLPAENTFTVSEGTAEDFHVTSADSTNLKSYTGGNNIKLMAASETEEVKAIKSGDKLYEVNIQSSFTKKNETDEPNRVCIHIGGYTYVYDIEENRIVKSDDASFASLNKTTATGSTYVLNAYKEDVNFCKCDFSCNGEFSPKSLNAYANKDDALANGINYKFYWYSNGVLDIVYYNAEADGINKPGKIELPGIGFEKAFKYTTMKGDVSPTVTNITGKTVLSNKKEIVTEGLGTAIMPVFTVSANSPVITKIDDVTRQRQYVLNESDNLFHIQIADYDGSPFFVGGDDSIFMIEENSRGWETKQLTPPEFTDFSKYNFNSVKSIMTDNALKNFTPFVLASGYGTVPSVPNFDYYYYVSNTGTIDVIMYPNSALGFDEKQCQFLENKEIGKFTVLNGLDYKTADNKYFASMTTDFTIKGMENNISLPDYTISDVDFKANNNLVTLKTGKTEIEELGATVNTTSIIAKKGYKCEPIHFTVKPSRALDFNKSLTFIFGGEDVVPVVVPVSLEQPADDETNDDYVNGDYWQNNITISKSFVPKFAVSETEPASTEPTSTEPSSPNDSIVYGDVDGSGRVDIMDVIKINKFILGSGVIEPEHRKAADIDKNDSVDSSDSLNILKIVVGILTKEDIAALQK